MSRTASTPLGPNEIIAECRRCNRELLRVAGATSEAATALLLDLLRDAPECPCHRYATTLKHEIEVMG